MNFDNIFNGENKNNLVIISVLLCAVVFFSVANSFFRKNNEMSMEDTIEAVAKLYYKESYYPDAKIIYNDYLEVLKDLENGGIYLSLDKIISSFEDIESTKFYEKAKKCDLVKTYAIIYPKFPYGSEDVNIKVVLSCDDNN